MLKTAETVTYEIFREIVRAVRQFEAERLLVIASPKVVGRITDEESAAVAELEEFLGKSIRFQADEQYLRSEEHTSELQSLMRISYAVFCLKKKKKTN